MSAGRVLAATHSVCPECLRRVPAQRVARGDSVYLQKSCPEHGAFETIIWRGPPAYESWAGLRLPLLRPGASGPSDCPWDCGLCDHHQQQTCTALLEVTQRCGLGCAFCFADAGRVPGPDPSLETIRGWFHKLLAAGGPYNVQLSGGEPTLRPDLPQIIALGRSLGFGFIQLNSNGLRLGNEPGYAQALQEAGLASVFLQFDGVDDAPYQALTGRALMDIKLATLESCAQAGLGVVLVPRLAPGVNLHQAGAIIDLALRHLPTVRGVHFQPVSYFGRHPGPPGDEGRLTIPDILRALEEQTQGRLRVAHFQPPNCENPYCSFSGNFRRQGSELKPWAKPAAGAHCSEPRPAAEGALRSRRYVARFWAGGGLATEPASEDRPGLGGWEEHLARLQAQTLSISGMAFQDAWSLDLERLRDCCIHVVHPDGRLIPFCAYNLTDRQGRSHYRPARPAAAAERP
ncbi:MAG: radical SAM (seleno)protein TrsS [Thermodesulfobacteriota bacterium]